VFIGFGPSPALVQIMLHVKLSRLEPRHILQLGPNRSPPFYFGYVDRLRDLPFIGPDYEMEQIVKAGWSAAFELAGSAADPDGGRSGREVAIASAVDEYDAIG
jgi:hypothetical protein